MKKAPTTQTVKGAPAAEIRHRSRSYSRSHLSQFCFRVGNPTDLEQTGRFKVILILSRTGECDFMMFDEYVNGTPKGNDEVAFVCSSCGDLAPEESQQLWPVHAP
jgi:hypothetical protein